MLVEAMYFAIFFDVDKPRNDKFAIKRRINYAKYINLTDEVVPDKEVELDEIKYKIVDHLTFNIINSVDNHHILVCGIEKIK
jgi:hypothetical protein